MIRIFERIIRGQIKENSILRSSYSHESYILYEYKEPNILEVTKEWRFEVTGTAS
jgi:hypothetical protein